MRSRPLNQREKHSLKENKLSSQDEEFTIVRIHLFLNCSQLSYINNENQDLFLVITF